MAGTIDSRVQAQSGLGVSRRSVFVALLAAALLTLAAVLVLRSGTHHSKPLAPGTPGAAASHRAGSPPSLSASPASGARSSDSRPPAPPASSSASHSSGQARPGAVAVLGGRATVAEVADPQESQSFPAPASAQHQAAASPATAGAEVIAAGAPSDAEVRRELAQMQAVERRALQTQQRQLTATPGGASIGGNGTIPIPANAPEVVQKVIAGANAIADFPYVFGGGHASFVDNAYDCSGSVSYALAAGGLLSAPETSGDLESWGAAGPGRYITVYANAGHTYMYVDGVLYDTAGRSGVYASRWLVGSVDNSGFVARHWPGL